MKLKLLFLLLIFMFVSACATYNCCNNQTQIPAKEYVGKTKKDLPYVGETERNDCVITLYVTGKGAPPSDEDLSEVQRYLLAERAAIVDGYRLISEKLEGILVEAYTKVGEYAVEYDKIQVATRAFLKGVEIINIKHKSNGVCLAEMKITITRQQLCCYFPDVVVQHINTCCDNNADPI